MDWCEASGVDYVFGLTGTPALAKKVDGTADAVRTERAVADKAAVRDPYTQARRPPGRGAAKNAAPSPASRATKLGLDIRLRRHQHRNQNRPRWLYDTALLRA